MAHVYDGFLVHSRGGGGGEVMEIGQIDPGITFVASPLESGTHAVEPPRWMKLPQGASLEASSEAISRCELQSK